jgi:hypothetical protein
MWNMAKKMKKVKNLEKSTVVLGIWQDNWKCGSWVIHPLGHEIWRGKLKKVENLEMSTVGHGIWQENWKSWKMRNIHERLEKWWNHWKTSKMRNAHCTNWNMVRKVKITENEKYIL